MNRWKPYICPSCQERFIHSEWWGLADAVIGFAILVPLARSGVGWWTLGGAFAVYLLLSSILVYLFVPLTRGKTTTATR